MKKEYDEDSGDKEEGTNILWQGTLGGRSVRISVGSFQYSIEVDSHKYYFSTLHGGLSYIVNEIVRMNMKDMKKKYEKLEELLEDIRKEYYKLRMEIEEKVGVNNV